VLENADSVHQGAMHSGCLPSIADNVHFMEVLNIEDYETPSRFRQSSSLPVAMRYAQFVLSATNTYSFTEDET